MTKRLVELDDADLAAAQEIMGTRTMKETVGRALREVLATDARRREVQRLTAGSMSELADPEVRASLWH